MCLILKWKICPVSGQRFFPISIVCHFLLVLGSLLLLNLFLSISLTFNFYGTYGATSIKVLRSRTNIQTDPYSEKFP